jgi:Plasmid recombination enzyme
MQEARWDGVRRSITATIHRDEKTPHLSAFVVPLTQDGRLSAKDFIGNKAKMTADQTTFAKSVEHLGLQRGIERSKATHTSIKQHYAAIQKDEITAGHVTITAESLKPRKFKPEGLAEKLRFFERVESIQGVADRLTQAVNNALAATFAKASESVQNERRAKELSKTMAQQQKRLESLQAPFRGLAKNQIEDLLKQAIKLGQENQKIRAKQDQERQKEISRSKSEHSWGR